MPVVNIIDNRTRRYRSQLITAIVEPACQDNSVKDSDHYPRGPDDWSYDELPEASVQHAISWAGMKPGATTLYLWDLGDGISTDRTKREPVSTVGEKIVDGAEKIGKALDGVLSSPQARAFFNGIKRGLDEKK